MHTDRDQARAKKRASADRLLAEIAILCTIALHGLFYYGFRTQPVIERHAQIAAEPSCVFVPSDTPVKLADWEKRLIDWSWLMDPTAAARPDEVQGFSRTRQLTDPEPVTPFPTYSFAVNPVSETTLPEIQLSHPLPSLAEAFRSDWTLALPPLPPAPPVAEFPNGIVWRNTAGAMLTDMPPLEMQQLLNALENNTELPTDATIIEISRDAGLHHLPRIRVRKSCGRPALDRMVVNALRNNTFLLYIQEAYHGKMSEKSYWPKAGGRRVVEIDWSLLKLRQSPVQEGGK